jgi:hypothetical protein
VPSDITGTHWGGGERGDMIDNKEQFVTTLLFSNEYMHHLNQVSGVTTERVIYLKRKFLSKSGYELINYPLADCVSITYKDERSPMTLVLGTLLVILVGGILYGVIRYWDVLPAATRIPVGALALALLYGLRMAFGARRHRLIFGLKDGTRLSWQTRSGDYKHKQVNAAKVVDLAKARGILAT